MSEQRTPEVACGRDEALQIVRASGGPLNVRQLTGVITVLYPDQSEHVGHQQAEPDVVMVRRRRRQGWVRGKQ